VVAFKAVEICWFSNVKRLLKKLLGLDYVWRTDGAFSDASAYTSFGATL